MRTIFFLQKESAKEYKMGHEVFGQYNWYDEKEPSISCSVLSDTVLRTQQLLRVVAKHIHSVRMRKAHRLLLKQVVQTLFK